MPWTCPTCKHVFDVGPSVPITPPEAHAEAGELTIYEGRNALKEVVEGEKK